METLTLTASELRCLEYLALSGPATLAAMRNNSGVHPRSVSRSSESLQDKGFAELGREGLSKTIQLTKSKHAQLFRRLVLEYRHMQFHKILSGSAIRVLSAISSMDLKNRKEIHANSMTSEASVARVLSRLKRIGVVVRREAGYKVSERFQTLADFVLEFRRYLNQKFAQSFSRDAIIVWERNAEFIIETSREQEEKGFRATGPSAFGRFGVTLMMQVSYYYYSPHDRQLGIDDLVVHSLLLGQQERNAMAILLAWKKNEDYMTTTKLYSKARGYGVAKEVEAFSAYLQSRGDIRHLRTLPPWSEFAAKAEEYQIRV